MKPCMRHGGRCAHTTNNVSVPISAPASRGDPRRSGPTECLSPYGPIRSRR
ncbi:MAG: hypothetical protein GX456_03985 [Verrucomicrobia bacterium]|nr:hypothetical protein [Verrucomicrobiota bacterium]